MGIIPNEDIVCMSCKHYESYHKYANPLAVARHWCVKCNDEIKVYGANLYYPKGCYFNDYYEEREEHKKMVEKRYKISPLACQVED